MHFFGIAGFLSFFISTVVFIWTLFLKFFEHVSFIKTPLPILVAIFLVIGIQFVLMGLLAELIIRHTPKEVEHYKEIDIK